MNIRKEMFLNNKNFSISKNDFLFITVAFPKISTVVEVVAVVVSETRLGYFQKWPNIRQLLRHL